MVLLPPVITTLMHKDTRPREGGAVSSSRDENYRLRNNRPGPANAGPCLAVLEEALTAGWLLHLEQLISLFQLQEPIGGGERTAWCSCPQEAESVPLCAESTDAPPRR